jgi:hypothetical protein
LLVADFLDEGTQFGQRLLRLERQLLVVDRQDEGEARLCCWAKEVRSP